MCGLSVVFSGLARQFIVFITIVLGAAVSSAANLWIVLPKSQNGSQWWNDPAAAVRWSASKKPQAGGEPVKFFKIILPARLTDWLTAWLPGCLAGSTWKLIKSQLMLVTTISENTQRPLLTAAFKLNALRNWNHNLTCLQCGYYASALLCPNKRTYTI